MDIVTAVVLAWAIFAVAIVAGRFATAWQARADAQTEAVKAHAQMQVAQAEQTREMIKMQVDGQLNLIREQAIREAARGDDA